MGELVGVLQFHLDPHVLTAGRGWSVHGGVIDAAVTNPCGGVVGGSASDGSANSRCL